MQTYLRHDQATGHLMLVMADMWDGYHERTEYHVVNNDGIPYRRGAEFDGEPVYGRAGAWYIKPLGREVRVNTLPGERAETVKIPCPRAENKRRKCALCG